MSDESGEKLLWCAVQKPISLGMSCFAQAVADGVADAAGFRQRAENHITTLSVEGA